MSNFVNESLPICGSGSKPLPRAVLMYGQNSVLVCSTNLDDAIDEYIQNVRLGRKPDSVRYIY